MEGSSLSFALLEDAPGADDSAPALQHDGRSDAFPECADLLASTATPGDSLQLANARPKPPRLSASQHASTAPL